MDYYELLEVREDASPEVIKMAYKALCRKYHPDVYKGDLSASNDIMQRINEAYGVLSNTETRAAYDNLLKYARNGENTSKRDFNMNHDEHEAEKNTQSSKERRFFDPFEDKKEASPLPINWLTFFSIFLCLGSIAGTVRLIFSVIEISTYGFSITSYLAVDIYIIILYSLDFLSALFCIILFISFRKPTYRTFILTKIFLIFMPCPPLFIILSTYYYSWEPLYFIILALPFIYSALNLIYFEKRKYLFNDNAPFPTISTTGKYRTPYIIKPLIISLIILISAFGTTALYNIYGIDSFARMHLAQEEDEKVQEQSTTDTDIIANFDHLAQFYDWENYNEFIMGMENNYEIELQSLSLQEAFEKISTVIFGIQPYDETFGFEDPFTNTIIDSFGNYQNYVLAVIKKYEATQQTE